jgi:hypothetical protein
MIVLRKTDFPRLNHYQVFSDRNESDKLVSTVDMEMKIHEPRTMEFTLGSETPVNVHIFPHQASIGVRCAESPFFCASPVASHASVFSLQ